MFLSPHRNRLKAALALPVDSASCARLVAHLQDNAPPDIVRVALCWKDIIELPEDVPDNETQRTEQLHAMRMRFFNPLGIFFVGDRFVDYFSNVAAARPALMEALLDDITVRRFLLSSTNSTTATSGTQDSPEGRPAVLVRSGSWQVGRTRAPHTTSCDEIVLRSSTEDSRVEDESRSSESTQKAEKVDRTGRVKKHATGKSTVDTAVKSTAVPAEGSRARKGNLEKDKSRRKVSAPERPLLAVPQTPALPASTDSALRSRREEVAPCAPAMEVTTAASRNVSKSAPLLETPLCASATPPGPLPLPPPRHLPHRRAAAPLVTQSMDASTLAAALGDSMPIRKRVLVVDPSGAVSEPDDDPPPMEALLETRSPRKKRIGRISSATASLSQALSESIKNLARGSGDKGGPVLATALPMLSPKEREAAPPASPRPDVDDSSAERDKGREKEGDREKASDRAAEDAGTSSVEEGGAMTSPPIRRLLRAEGALSDSTPTAPSQGTDPKRRLFRLARKLSSGDIKSAVLGDREVREPATHRDASTFRERDKREEGSFLSPFRRRKKKVEDEDRPASIRPPVDLLTSFEELILEPQFIVLKTLCKETHNKGAAEMRPLMDAAIQLLTSFDLVPNFLRVLFTSEMQERISQDILFRGDSTATAVASRYFELYGHRYLQILQAPLSHVFSRKKALEVDPDQLSGGRDEQAENVRRLMRYSKRFFMAIVSSVEDFPVAFRRVLSRVRRIVCGTYPEFGDQIVSTIVMLRFFCPAIISPSKYGLCRGDIPRHTQRSLVLIAKLLQNLANGIAFGNKESYMSSCSTFLEENIGTMRKYIDDLLNEDMILKKEIDLNRNQVLPTQAPRKSLRVIHQYLVENFSACWKEVAAETVVVWRFEEFCKLGLTTIAFPEELEDSSPFLDDGTGRDRAYSL